MLLYYATIACKLTRNISLTKQHSPRQELALVCEVSDVRGGICHVENISTPFSLIIVNNFCLSGKMAIFAGVLEANPKFILWKERY